MLGRSSSRPPLHLLHTASLIPAVHRVGTYVGCRYPSAPPTLHLTMVGDTLKRRGLGTLTLGRVICTKKVEHCQGPSFRSLYRLTDSEFPNSAWLLRMWHPDFGELSRVVKKGDSRSSLGHYLCVTKRNECREPHSHYSRIT
jgi:hypothetical protein